MNLRTPMKKIMALMIVAGCYGLTARAEDNQKKEEQHEQNPSVKAKEGSATKDQATSEKHDMGAMGHDMSKMGGSAMMSMQDMMSMMGQCQDMHKDSKMCDHDIMSKCQEGQKAGACKKMMKKAKAETKKSK